MRDTRIQKAMADWGLCSRRQAEQIILEGRVKLNGRPVQLGDKMDIRADILSVDGENIVLKPYRPCCIFCNETDGIAQFMGKNVCKSCVNKLKGDL